MNTWVYILIPVYSALTGWLAIWVLFKFMLPKLKKQLPAQLSGLLANEISGFINIEKEFSDPANLRNILPLIETHIDDFLRNKLPVEMPMIAMFVGDKTIGTLKNSFLKEMQLLFPEVMQQYAVGLKNKFDPRLFIQQKLGARLGQIEEKLEQRLRKEFRSAGLLGSLVGLISGLVLVLILLILN